MARSTLALTHFQLKNFAQVIETLRPDPRLADADTKVSYAYAIALVKTGQTAAGIERLKTLDQALPNSPQIRAALAEAQAVADTDSPRK